MKEEVLLRWRVKEGKRRKIITWEYVITKFAIRKYFLNKREKIRLIDKFAIGYFNFWAKIGWRISNQIIFSFNAIESYYLKERKIVLVPKIIASTNFSEMIIIPKDNKKEILQILKERTKKTINII